MYRLLAFLLPVLLALVFSVDRSKGIIITIITLFTLDMFGIQGTFPGWPFVIILFFFIPQKTKCEPNPLRGPFILMFFSYMVSWIFGEYNKLPSIIIPVAYLILASMAWKYYKPSKENNRFLIYAVIIFALVNIVYGAYESFTFTKPFREWVDACNPAFARESNFHERFGISKAHGLCISFTFFGISTLMYLMLLGHLVVENDYVRLNKTIATAMCFACIFGILITCDRTTIAATAIALTSMLSLLKNNKIIILCALMIAIIAYIQFQDFFDLMIFSFTHSDEVVGSSSDMRFDQFDAAFSFFLRNPLFGNGLESHDACIRYFPHILGAESIIFRLFYARGIIGIIASSVLYLATFGFFLRKKCYSICIIFAAFLFYEIVTIPVDELYVYPFLFIIYKIQTQNKLQINDKV